MQDFRESKRMYELFQKSYNKKSARSYHLNDGLI